MSTTLLAANVVAWTVQTTVIIAAALALMVLLRIGAPSVRYLLLRLLLGACLVLPIVQPRVVSSADVDAVGDLRESRFGFTSAWPGRSVPALQEKGAGSASAGGIALAEWPMWLLLAIGAGAVARLAWIAAGLLRLRTLRIIGEEAPPSADYDELQDRVGARVHVRFVPFLGQPVTFGTRRPVILLPEMLRTLPVDIQRAVLAHELWHVRRYDWIWVLIEESFRATFWFHPAMWALISRIQAAREETVDELAILSTGSRRSYLDALIAFADRPSLFAAAAFARRRHLVRRILLISKESVMSSRRIVACSAVLMALVCGTSWYAVSAFPLIGPAQTPRDRLPPPPPPPPSKFAMMEEQMLKKAKEEPNAVNYYGLTTLYYERARGEPSLTPDHKSQLIAQGITAADRALSYDADFVEPMIYKNLLLRLQAQLATDPAERSQLIAEADRLRSRAMELRKQQPERQAVPPPGMPAPPPPPPPPPPPDDVRGDSQLVDGEAPIRVGGNVMPPAKTRDVKPIYPPDAHAAGIQGVVIIEATIGRDGRVRDTRVLRSIPMLDEAALGAVRQWEFSPTHLNGVAVPVIMTVTVSFTLQ